MKCSPRKTFLCKASGAKRTDRNYGRSIPGATETGTLTLRPIIGKKCECPRSEFTASGSAARRADVTHPWPRSSRCGARGSRRATRTRDGRTTASASASSRRTARARAAPQGGDREECQGSNGARGDRKSTRLNSSHVEISYAVFCLKKKKKKNKQTNETLKMQHNKSK